MRPLTASQRPLGVRVCKAAGSLPGSGDSSTHASLLAMRGGCLRRVTAASAISSRSSSAATLPVSLAWRLAWLSPLAHLPLVVALKRVALPRSGRRCCSPKRFLLPLHVLLGPFLPLVSSLFGWIADSTARKHNKTHGMPPRAGSASAGEQPAPAAR